MTLVEQASFYYGEQGNNCAVSILLAANDVYCLGLSPDAASLVVGFGAGINCGAICGCLAGAVAVLGKLYSKQENFRQICADFVAEFEEKMGCNSHNCKELSAVYKTEEKRCLDAVVRGAEILESFIAAQ